MTQSAHLPSATVDPAGSAELQRLPPALDGLVTLATRLCRMPRALLWVHGPGDTAARIFASTEAAKAGLVLDLPGLERRMGRDDLLLIPNLGAEERQTLCGVPAEAGASPGSLAVLRLQDHRIGTTGLLCLMDVKPHCPSAEEIDSLRLIGRQIESQLHLDHHHNTEQALKAEQQLTRSIFAHSPIGIAIYDRDGNCVVANEALGRHAGCTMAELLQQNIHRLQSWQEIGVYALALRALNTGRHTSGVVTGTSSFGKPITLGIDFTVLDTPGAGKLMLMTQDLAAFKLADDARRAMQERFEMLFVNSMDGILLGRPDGTLTAANPAACRMLGLSEAEIVARGRTGVLDTSDPRLVTITEERRLTGRSRGEVGMVRGDGTILEVEFTSVLYPDSQGRMLSSAILRDTRQRRMLEQKLRESHELLSRLTQRIPGVLYQFRLYPDGRSCFPFASEGIRTIYELSPDDVREDASKVFARLHPDDREAIVASIEVSAKTLKPWRLEYRVVLPKQGVRWRQGDARPERLPDGSVLWHGFIMDYTEQRREAEKTHWLAYFDALTALPNRRLFLDRIGQALALARRTGQQGALMFIDLDHFKRINDARGHGIGDALLQEVARRLSATVRSQDTVARIGGDEFVLLVGELGADPEAATRAAIVIADKVRAALDEPYRIEDQDYASSASLGITLYPKGAEGVDDLFREADTAMYRAKAAGRNRVAFFEAAMQEEVEETLALEHDLKEAISLGQMSLVVQGQFNADGHLAGAELLLRWHHPQRGMIPPTRFIPLAENSGQIHRLGDWVIRQGAEALTRLHAQGSPLSLSINVSPVQFRDEGFVDRVRDILASAGAPPGGLILEVTEGLLIEDRAVTAARMHQLVELGVRFSIDDFGTGFCNFQYLKDLPLYEIKIDRAFVQGIPDDPKHTAIVTAILAMADPLELRVVAEGVETPDQAEFLLQSGCDAVQGYLFARPVPFDAWLRPLLGLPADPPPAE